MPELASQDGASLDMLDKALNSVEITPEQVRRTPLAHCIQWVCLWVCAHSVGVSVGALWVCAQIRRDHCRAGSLFTP